MEDLESLKSRENKKFRLFLVLILSKLFISKSEK